MKADARGRTGDLPLTKRLLCHLSYVGGGATEAPPYTNFYTNFRLDSVGLRRIGSKLASDYSLK